MSYAIFPDGKYGEATEAAYQEIIKSREKHGTHPFHNTHEAYGVILEEVEEMWDEIKKNNVEKAVKEAIQVAAMAIRFVAEFGTYPYGQARVVPINRANNLESTLESCERNLLDTALNAIKK